MTAEKLKVASGLADEIEKLENAIADIEKEPMIAIYTGNDRGDAWFTSEKMVITSKDIPGLRDFILDALKTRKQSLIESFLKL